MTFATTQGDVVAFVHAVSAKEAVSVIVPTKWGQLATAAADIKQIGVSSTNVHKPELIFAAFADDK